MPTLAATNAWTEANHRSEDLVAISGLCFSGGHLAGPGVFLHLRQVVFQNCEKRAMKK